mmetsp:Transcript_5139/g.7084  ORF Transcript_5139/g.7084 Transcript_5139/m.7084 type:complete len:135 (-) Transcript_5139:35-439(-)
MPSASQLCLTCEATNATLICKKCQCAAYCNTTCQKDDSEHRQYCVKTKRLEDWHFEGLEKDLILEDGSGRGGGMLVREGYPLLTAYALAFKIPRSQLLDVLNKAEGTLSEHWTTCLNENERLELGVLCTGDESF